MGFMDATARPRLYGNLPPFPLRRAAGCHQLRGRKRARFALLVLEQLWLWLRPSAGCKPWTPEQPVGGFPGCLPVLDPLDCRGGRAALRSWPRLALSKGAPLINCGGSLLLQAVDWRSPNPNCPQVLRGGCQVSQQLADSLGRCAPGATIQLYRLPAGCGAPAEELQAPLARVVLRLCAAAARDDIPAIQSVPLPPSMAGGNAAAEPQDPAKRLLMGLSPVASRPQGGGSKRATGPPRSASAKALGSSWALAALSGKDSRGQGLLRSLVARHLAGRHLVAGTVCLVPVLGQDTVFVVESAFSSSGALVAVESLIQRAAVPAELSVTATQVELLQPDERLPDRPGASADAAAAALEDLCKRAAEAAEAEHGGQSGKEAAAIAARQAVTAGWLGLGVDVSSLGGIEDKTRALEELVVMPLQRPETFQRYGIRPPRGVLLHGPPGTGKTMLCRAAATAAGATLFVVNGPDIVSEFLGESEAGLGGVFAAARALAPSVIFIDELDAIAPSREKARHTWDPAVMPQLCCTLAFRPVLYPPPLPKQGSKGGGGMDLSSRLVASLLVLMDGLGGGDKGDRVVVLAATNRPDAIDEALRRPGRFDRELEVGVPTPTQRESILRARLQPVAHALPEEEVHRVAAAAHGFVAADLAALVNEACLHALRRVVAGGAGELRVTLEDLRAAENLVRPSAMREMAIEVPRVRWADIGGLEDVKQRLREAVEWPVRCPEALERIGATAPKGVLLYGPPGCSKTLLARAVASEAQMNFLAVKGPELFSKWVGESEKAVAAIFAKARWVSSPAIPIAAVARCE